MATPDRTFSADQPEKIAEALFDRKRRVLVLGEIGAGKTTLVKGLSQCLEAAGVGHRIIVADPGSPAFGIPGAVCRGALEKGDFRIEEVQAICSLDAGRFRLPLMEAVGRLAAAACDPILLIDAPGLTRGIAAAELLTGLIGATAADTLLVLIRQDRPAPLAAECQAAGIAVIPVYASGLARAPNARQRRRARTDLWNACASAFSVRRISLAGRPLLGTPPPATHPRLWSGRQIALVEKQRTIAMGEVVAMQSDHMIARLPALEAPSGSLLVRDAGRNAHGELVTLPPQRPAGRPTSASTISPGITVHLGSLTASLVNGIFGDPLLHLRLPNQKRSLLFDLGDGNRLPARIAHQVSDVFITHAHMDHISGFYWLLRARIGNLPVCRLYGTAALSRRIGSMIEGIHWDRIGDRGPRFAVMELEGEKTARYHTQVGRGAMKPIATNAPFDGCLVDTPDFTVRAAVLEHGIPVLALVYEEKPGCRVIDAALRQSGYPPGPWLGELKRRLAAGEHDAIIPLPDGSRQPAAGLARNLIRRMPGRRLAYATDVADSPANRKKLIDLVRGADIFFCEAAYAQAHRHLAEANGHLTARACGEIAAAAGVRSLVPFHLSHRYERDPERVFSEIRAGCPEIVLVAPPGW